MSLSSRIMNMKFMKTADVKENAQIEEDQNKKIKDLSEWVLPNSASILKKANLTNSAKIVGSVGYASINSFETISRDFEDDKDERPVQVKRSWGEKPVPKKKDLNKKLKNSKSIKKESEKSEPSPNEGSLDALWETLNKSNKREHEKQEEVKTPQIQKKRQRFPSK